MLGSLSIILFIPTAKNFQDFQRKSIYEKTSLNRAKKNIAPDTPHEIIENSISESLENKFLEKELEDQFTYYYDDPVSSSRSEPIANKTPRILDPDSEVTCFFLHIAKSGGTSLSVQLNEISKASRRRFTYQRIPKWKHFDWSGMTNWAEEKKIDNYEVVTLLRDPIQRAISHFNFIKTQSWVSEEYKKTSLEDYLNNPAMMMDYRDVWQDGQSSLAWLTGNQIADSWILHLPSSETKEKREDRSLNYKEQLNLAADRLESTLWFGINEMMEDSVNLLRKTTNIPFRNLMTGKLAQHVNDQRRTVHGYGDLKANLSPTVRNKLANLMPMDMIFFEYATKVFEARKEYFQTGEYNSPNRDLFGKKLDGCLSTRFVLVCKKDIKNLFSSMPGVSVADSNDKMFEINRHALVYRSPAMNDEEMEGQSELMRKMIKILKPNRPYKSFVKSDQEKRFDIKL